MNQLGKIYVQHYQKWEYYTNNAPISINALSKNGMSTKQVVQYCRYIENLRSLLICARIDDENRDNLYVHAEKSALELLAFFGKIIGVSINPKKKFSRFILPYFDIMYDWKDEFYQHHNRNIDQLGTLYLTFDDFRVGIERFLAYFAEKPDSDIVVNIPKRISDFGLAHIEFYMKKEMRKKAELEQLISHTKEWQSRGDELQFTKYNEFAQYAKEYAIWNYLNDELEDCELDIEELEEEHEKKKGICSMCDQPVFLDGFCKFHLGEDRSQNK